MQSAAYTTYTFGTFTYYSTDPDVAASTTVPTATAVTTGYTWTLAGGGSYASVNASTGAITVSSLPDADQTLTLTCTVAANGLTKAATKTITLKSDTRTVANPTGITANDVTIYQGSTLSYTAYTLTVADPTNTKPYNYVSAVSDNTAVATVTNSGGTFAINGLAVGTATITITPYNQDNTTAAVTATFTVTVEAPQSGVSGGVVTLNDYEDHSWSYYSDASLPARMRSLLPANVVITYYGNGTNTVTTSADASPALDTFTASTDNSVAVGIGEPEATFVYYKTLERTSGNAYGSAAYNYTTIPNPFSIRPTYGTGDTRWRGFYAWRIKSVSGGTISGKAVGDIIDAEATVSFVPTGEYGMSVELEALWARAYVGSGLQASVGRERNFIIVSSNTGSTMDAVRVSTPCTYSSFYPNGTTNGTAAATLANRATRRATFTATADSKIEYMLLDGNTNTYNMSANAHSLTLGRGIGAAGGTHSCYTFSSINSNHTEDLDFTVRIESGVYHDVDLMAAGNTLGGRVHNHFIFGSDYDRATGDDSKLDVAPTGTTEIHFATPQIAEVNKDKPVLDIEVKSGEYQKNRWYDNNTSAYNYSFYCHSTENASYLGLVSMTVEGGHFANISGGHMFGSIFGSGENGHVWENARLNISGGEIGSETGTLIYSGNVYGSGRGVDHPHGDISETAGKVRGNTTVNITGGTVWRDVYGGGSLASVGDGDEVAADSKKNVTTDPLTHNPFPFATGLTRVIVDGSSVFRGSVYGSGRGVASTETEYKQAAYVKNTLVTVKGSAHVYQNVYGGGNNAEVEGNAKVFIGR